MRTTARLLAPILGIAVVVWPFAAAAIWIVMVPTLASALPQIEGPIRFTPSILVAGGTFAFLVGCVQAYGLSGARMTLSAVAEGRPLSLQAIVGLRRFARIELLMVFLSVVQHTVSILIITGFRATEMTLSISFGSQHIGRLLLAIVLLLAVEGMARGREAMEENESFL